MLKNAQEIGTLIVQRRRERGLTQAELAERVFVSAQAVSKWERGETMPEMDRLQEIALVLGMKTTEFMQLEREDTLEGDMPGDELYRALEDKTDLTEVLFLAPEMSAETLKRAYGILRRIHGLDNLSLLFAYMPVKMVEELASEEYRSNGTANLAVFQPYIGSELSDRVLLVEYMRNGIRAALPLMIGGKNSRAIAIIFKHHTDIKRNWLDFMNALSLIPQDVLVSQALKITRELNAGLDPWKGWWVRLGSDNTVKFLMAYLDEQQDAPTVWGQVAQYYCEMPLDPYGRQVIEQRILRVHAEKGFEAARFMLPYLSNETRNKLYAAIDPERDGVTVESLQQSFSTGDDSCVNEAVPERLREAVLDEINDRLDDLEALYYALQGQTGAE